jgi:plasmid stabilization system protein ParE
VTVVFTEHAVHRLRQIFAHIAADLPENAGAVVERIIERAERIDQPGQERLHYDADIYELRQQPYRIYYRMQGEVAQVLTVMHERELLPDEIPVPTDG